MVAIFPLTASAQSKERNYVLSRTMLDSTATASVVSVNYYNGLGDLSETVVQTGDNDETSATLVEYDGARRPYRSWAPVPAGASVDYLDEKSVQNASSTFYDDSNGYSVTEYDPYDREVSSLMPGKEWHSDYNANINWIVCGQPIGNRLNVLKSFYVKYERKLPALVDDFCRYYAAHANHTVVFYYDATALGSNYAVNDQDFHWVVKHEFERHGWQVIDVYLGNPMRHDEKYLLINQGFAGKQRLMPFFNRQNNDDLILAIQSAGVERGRNGFRKNKSKEKDPESEEDLLEHRTDGTDAFDTLYIGCEKFPQHDIYPVGAGGVM